MTTTVRRSIWLALAALLSFHAVAAAVCLQPPYFAWDLEFSQSVQSLQSEPLTMLMRVVSWPGDDVRDAAIVIGLALAVLLAFRRWREALVFLGVVLVGQGLKIGLKLLIGRPRPSQELVSVLINAHEVNSFPSGHTVHYTVAFGFLFFLTWRLVKPPMARWPLLVLWGLMVLLVGFARIYLGAHWVTDIIGGYLLGGAILAAGIAIYDRWLRPA